jgi:hypothetical protein
MSGLVAIVSRDAGVWSRCVAARQRLRRLPGLWQRQYVDGDGPPRAVRAPAAGTAVLVPA